METNPAMYRNIECSVFSRSEGKLDFLKFLEFSSYDTAVELLCN